MPFIFKQWRMLSLVVFNAIFLVHCGSRDLSEAPEIVYPANFAQIRDRILRPRCGNCHPKILQFKEVTSHLAISGKPQSSELFTVIENDEMPPYGSKLTSDEKAAIRRWIENGLPAN